MSFSRSDVLDRVLNRIAGNGRSAVRSPGRNADSSAQRDVSRGRPTSGVKQRGSGRPDTSKQASHTTSYRTPTSASSAAHVDSSLAGTTVMPQLVFPRSILKAPVQVAQLLSMSTSSNRGHTASSTAAAQPGSSTAAAKATPAPAPAAESPALATAPVTAAASGAAALQPQPTHPQRAVSPQPQKLPSHRSGSPDSRARSSSAAAGCSNGMPEPGVPGVAATRPATEQAQAAPSGIGTKSPRSLEEPTAESKEAQYPSDPAATSCSGSGTGGGGNMQRLSSGGHSGNTITRTAALRALKQQRSVTPERMSEMRPTSSAASTAAASDAAGVLGGASPCSGTASSARGAALASAAAARDAEFARQDAGEEAERATSASRSSAAASAAAAPARQRGATSLCALPVLQPSGQDGMDDEGGEGEPVARNYGGRHARPAPPFGPGLPADDMDACAIVHAHGRAVSPEPDSKAVSAEKGPRLRPLPVHPALLVNKRGARRPAAAAASGAAEDNGSNGRSSRVSEASSSSWGGLQSQGSGAHYPTAGAAVMTSLYPSQQASPSRGHSSAAAQELSPEPAAEPGRAESLQQPEPQEGAPAEGAQPASQLMQRQGFQGPEALAAQSRIWRLEEQVRGLTAQVAELQASRADLQFRLEEEQLLAAAWTSSSGEAGLASEQEPGHPGEAQELRRQLAVLLESRRAREADLLQRLAQAREAHETVARQNRELLVTLEGTLSAAEHVSTELKQLRASNAELKAAREASQQQVVQLQADLELRERALSAVQMEFSSLGKRYEEALVAAEAARREASLREGRLRRELETATQEASNASMSLAKLQREHAALHARKADRDKQLAVLTKKAEAQQEALAGAERLAQEHSALVRELESRATLLRNRNSALDRAVTAEKEAHRAAQEQVRQMEEEIALLVAIVRQSDPNLESLGKYQRDPKAAAALTASAAAVAAAVMADLPETDTAAAGAAGRTTGSGDSHEGPGQGGHARANSRPAAGIVRAAADGHAGGAAGQNRERALQGAQPPAPARGMARALSPQPYDSRRGGQPLSVRAPQPRFPSAPARQRPGHPCRDDALQPTTTTIYAHTATAMSSTASGALPEWMVRKGPGDKAPAAARAEDAAPASDPTMPCTLTALFGNGGADTQPGALPATMAPPYPVKRSVAAGAYIEHPRADRTAGGFNSPAPQHQQRTTTARAQSAFTGGNRAAAGTGCDSNGAEAAGDRRAWTPPGRIYSGARMRPGADQTAAVGPRPEARAKSAGRNGGNETQGGQKGLVQEVSAAAWVNLAGGAGNGGPKMLPKHSGTPPGTSAVQDRYAGAAAATAGASTAAAAAAATVCASASPHAAVGGSTQAQRRPRNGISGGGAVSSPCSMPLMAAAAAPAAAEAIDCSRVLWAGPRRGRWSTGGAQPPQAAGSRGAKAAPAPAEPESSGCGGTVARRAAATSVLVGAFRSGPLYASAGGVVEAVRPTEGSDPSDGSGGGSASSAWEARRARTPEPRTASAWVQLANAEPDVDPARRKRSATPDGRISATGRGFHKSTGPAPASHHQQSGPAVPQRLSETAVELAAILCPGAKALATAHSASGASVGAKEDQALDLEPALSRFELPKPRTSIDSARPADHNGSGLSSGGEDGGVLRSDGGIDEHRRSEPLLPLDEDSAIEVASPVKHARAHNDGASRRRAGGSGAESGREKDENYRASYAFDAPLGEPRQLFGSQSQLPGGADRDAKQPLDKRSAGGVDGGALGAALRSLQQRQAALLRQLADSPPPGAGPASPEPALDLIRGSAAQLQLQYGTVTASRAPSQSGSARAGEPPVSASFSFPLAQQGGQPPAGADPAPGDHNTVAVRRRASEGEAAGDGSRKRPARRTSVSFADELLPPPPQLPQPSSATAAAAAARQQPNAAAKQPPQSPLRSPRRPSVTAAAEAAVAAGAGVGGPLTALLDQLVSGGDTWRAATTSTSSSTVARSVPAAPPPSPRPSLPSAAPTSSLAAQQVEDVHASADAPRAVGHEEGPQPMAEEQEPAEADEEELCQRDEAEVQGGEEGRQRAAKSLSGSGSSSSSGNSNSQTTSSSGWDESSEGAGEPDYAAADDEVISEGNEGEEGRWDGDESNSYGSESFESDGESQRGLSDSMADGEGGYPVYAGRQGGDDGPVTFVSALSAALPAGEEASAAGVTGASTLRLSLYDNPTYDTDLPAAMQLALARERQQELANTGGSSGSAGGSPAATPPATADRRSGSWRAWATADSVHVPTSLSQAAAAGGNFTAAAASGGPYSDPVGAILPEIFSPPHSWVPLRVRHSSCTNTPRSSIDNTPRNSAGGLGAFSPNFRSRTASLDTSGRASSPSPESRASLNARVRSASAHAAPAAVASPPMAAAAVAGQDDAAGAERQSGARTAHRAIGVADLAERFREVALERREQGDQCAAPVQPHALRAAAATGAARTAASSGGGSATPSLAESVAAALAAWHEGRDSRTASELGDLPQAPLHEAGDRSAFTAPGEPRSLVLDGPARSGPSPGVRRVVSQSEGCLPDSALLERRQQQLLQPLSSLSLLRTSGGPVSGVVSCGGAAEWRRPPSPGSILRGVKPLSLDDVLRRPPSKAAQGQAPPQ